MKSTSKPHSLKSQTCHSNLILGKHTLYFCSALLFLCRAGGSYKEEGTLKNKNNKTKKTSTLGTQ